MTASEAKKYMLIEKECINRDCNRDCANCDIVQDVEDLNNAYDVAIRALEKQIPKNPTYEGDGYAPDGMFIWGEWICPCCGRRYEVDYDDYDYCPDCGQKLDWSEKE